MKEDGGTMVWDFFIAHAGADKGKAELLYDLLAHASQVFLDSRCLEVGDDWDTKLAAAQRTSLVTVVLISPKTEHAYYEREEIAAAIALAREADGKHRVVPLYLDSTEAASQAVPYGLRLKHALRLSDTFTLPDAARELLALLERLRPTSGVRGDAPAAVPPAPLKRDGYGILERSRARQRIESHIDELQAVLRRGVVDRDTAMEQLSALLTLTRAAEQAAQFEPQELDGIFSRGSQASRIVALAQVHPTAASLPMALEATSRPRSPWEQYLALLILEALVPSLTSGQRQEVRTAIERQRGGRVGQYITREIAGRWEVAGRILRKFRKDSSGFAGA